MVELMFPRLEWITLPARRSAIGVPRASGGVPVDELPATQVQLPAFRIGRTPITNAQYRAFLDATGHAPPGHWPGRQPPAGREHHPVTYVDWDDAMAFCRWAGVRL